MNDTSELQGKLIIPCLFGRLVSRASSLRPGFDPKQVTLSCIVDRSLVGNPFMATESDVITKPVQILIQ